MLRAPDAEYRLHMRKLTKCTHDAKDLTEHSFARRSQCEGSGAQEELTEEEPDVSKRHVESIVEVIGQSCVVQAGVLSKLQKN